MLEPMGQLTRTPVMVPLMLHTVFRATHADKYHKRFQTAEQVVSQTGEGKNSILITLTMTIRCQNHAPVPIFQTFNSE